ncbi:MULTISPECIES: hypothetical protein [unclassified Streptomyces]|jgi:hypothetical protein|uniref:hypothetical protein n=1 Tax=unclassified Streptomyces TaxID=2593676 RepID=UPI000D4105AB|nr:MULTISPECIES: hypothetical protein [unclassified Streptomyces]PTM99478.1 hypothetical protein C7821_102425 [Streptomyces sp. VMFN-G11Ma]
MRKTMAALSGLAIAIGLTVTATPIASAATQDAYGCAGTQVGTHNIKDTDGTVWGSIYVYYSSANGGTNCAVNVSKVYVGQPHHMEVHLFLGSKVVSDSGTYSSYAGPVRVTGADGKCIDITGEVDAPSGKSVAAGWYGVHCG